jgi:hypothetical protein
MDFEQDLRVRPISHDTPESIEAHLAIVFVEMAVSHDVEHQTGWGIDKFVRTNRRYRIVKTKAARESFMYRVAVLMRMPIHQDVEPAPSAAGRGELTATPPPRWPRRAPRGGGCDGWRPAGGPPR